MRKLAFVFIIIMLWGCSTTNVGITNTYIPVIRSGNYTGFDYYYGIQNNDTVVFIITPGIKAERGYRVSYINYKNLHTIDKVSNGQDTLHFTYTMYGSNNTSAIAGSGAPGSMQKTMHTFKSFPYLIDDDEVLIYENK
jgi:hypothetical protein